MGLLGGDPIAWRRWWLPADATPKLFDGFLPDPLGEYTRYLNSGAVALEDDGARARVLLADGGMGKSTELLAEVERLRGAGEHAELIDLGAYASTPEITGAIDAAVGAWQAAGSPGDLVLALDSYDEPLVDVTNLADVLSKALGALDTARLRVVAASRGSLWSNRLQRSFAQWWSPDEVVVLQLAPLTEPDVALAAESEGIDGDAFVAAVHKAGAGPLAARPITLRLMLAGARDGELPENRLGAYTDGVVALASESGERRRERLRTGVPVERRLHAARRLAAASLLSGRPTIVRRRTAEQRPGELALDQVSVEPAELDALDDVFESALLSGGGTVRTWCHHSVAEFLCAQALADLPVAAAWNLLAAPGDPTLIRPQLEETAAWTAVMHDDMFSRLLDEQLAVLVKGDLASRPAQDRERVGRALLRRLATDEPVLERAVAGALDYPGVDDDLRPLLATTQPTWRRREAVMLAAATQRRGLDGELLDIVRESSGRTGHDELISLSVYAAHALAEAQAPDVVASMRALAADPEVNLRVRTALVTSLFPRRLSADAAAAMFTADQRRSQPLGRTIAHAMQEAVDRHVVPAADVLGWFEAPDGRAHTDDRARRLAAAASLAVVAEGPDHPRWQAAVGIALSILRDHVRPLAWHADDIDALGLDRRREFARALLEGRSDDSMAGDLLDLRLIRSDDLLWWFDRLDDHADGNAGGGLSAGAVLRVLLGAAVDDDNALAAARERCNTSPILKALFGADLEPDQIARRRAWRAQADERRRAREQEQGRHLFSPQRLEDALSAGDLPLALDELDRTPSPEVRPPGPNGPTSAWTAAGDDARRRTADLAAALLQAHEFDLNDYDDVHLLTASIDVAAAAGQERLSAVPPDRWAAWLPCLLRSPSGAAARTCLTRALSHDPDSVAATTETLMAEHADGKGFGLQQWAIDALPPDITARLAARAVDLAARPDIPPDALPGLLAAANAALPGDSAQVALQHVERRGSQPPARTRHADAPATMAWARAVAAARAVIANPGPHDGFDRLLAAFAQDPAFAVDTVRSVDAWQTARAWKALTAEQLEELYLWASKNMPARNPPPGVAVNTDRAEELPGDILGILTERGDAEATAALRRLAQRTGNVYLRHSADRLAAQAAADVAAPPSPAAVLEVFDDPRRRAVTSHAQLVEAVLEALDEIAADYRHHRGLRRGFWERQRSGTTWSGTSVPAEETRVSELLKAELALRLRGRVAVVREVEIQPALGGQGADLPDIVAIAVTTDTSTLQVPLEVKGNYNDDVVGALTTQLADRYLDGPAGEEGIYAVAFFGTHGWDSSDKNRLRIAARRTPDELRRLLADEAAAAASRGKTVHVRVIEMPLADDD